MTLKEQSLGLQVLKQVDLLVQVLVTLYFFSFSFVDLDNKKKCFIDYTNASLFRVQTKCQLASQYMIWNNKK